jgi:hypothetical protein
MNLKMSLRAPTCRGEAIPATGRIIVKRVKGFNKARQLLTRENFWESFTTPPRLAVQIKQVFGEALSVQEVVNRIIGEVRDKGDKALFDYTEKLDGVRLDSLEVDR